MLDIITGAISSKVLTELVVGGGSGCPYPISTNGHSIGSVPGDGMTGYHCTAPHITTAPTSSLPFPFPSSTSSIGPPSFNQTGKWQHLLYGLACGLVYVLIC